MSSRLDSRGCPVTPTRISFGIRKETLLVIDFVSAMQRQTEVFIHVRTGFPLEGQFVRGWIQQVNSFPEGCVVTLVQSPGSFLSVWKDPLELWIPRVGQAGVLA
jgi:hypothetical protein